MNMTTSPEATTTPAAQNAPVTAATKPATKSAAQPVVKAKAAQAAKPATQRAAKPAVKAQATKPTAKAAGKPASTEAAKSNAKKQAAAPAKPLKDKKVKVVRDSFTIPKAELLQIGEMKKRALGLGVEIKKSELIRAGLSALAGMTDAGFKKALASVPTIKTGRPAKD